MKNKLLFGLILLVIGFIGGFVVQYSSGQQLKRDLKTANEQLAACKTSSQLWQVRDTAALLGLEIARSNYGTASDYSTRFFDEARQLASQTSDPNLQSTLQDILNSRDRITAGIARQDPAVLSEIPALVAKVHGGDKR
jgi:hypothetical protein